MGNGKLDMKSLLITVVASVTLFAAALLTVYVTPAPERTGASYVLAISPDASSTDDNAATASDDARPSISSEQKIPPESEQAIDGSPRAPDDVASNQSDAPVDRRFSGSASPWDAPLDSPQQSPEFPDPRSARPGLGEPSTASSRAIDGLSDQRNSGAVDNFDRRFSYPDAQDRPPSEREPANAGEFANAAREAPSEASPGQGAGGIAEVQPDAPSNPGSANSDAQEATKPGRDSRIETASPTPSRPQDDVWRATAVKDPTAAIPVPPVPKKRAQSQPPIPRGASSAAPQSLTDVRTAGAEERNAATALFAAATQAVGKPAPALGPNANGQVRIAVIIRDLGLDERDTYSAINSLRPEFTLAFSPYGRDVKGWALRARQSGHEVFAGIPMEPANIAVSDAAPNMLLASLSADENNRRLDWALSQVDSYQGVINIMGGKLAQSPDAIRPFMQSIKARGITYIDDGAAAHPYAIMLAAQLDVKYRVADAKVGVLPSPSSIQAELQKLEDLAREKGSALAVAAADPETLRQLVIWTAGLQSKAITLVHASQLVKPINLQ